jgi:predicted esterase
VAPPPDAAPDVWTAPPIDGPHEDLLLEPGRTIFHASPRDREAPRLVAHLHGMCGGPSYACGRWLGAGTSFGTMVCPTGNARCGDAGIGPPSWEAPTWPELVARMDDDLERAIAKVEARQRRTFERGDAILTGYSRGAFGAAAIVRRRPHRWRRLVLIEANAPLTAAGLRAAGVEAVALIAGEQGLEIAGMRRTAADLERDGFAARFFVMRRTGHAYGEDIELVMRDALAFVVGPRGGDAGP